MAKRTYFISDLHLGVDTAEYSSKDREYIVCDWMKTIESGSCVYFLGDIFDYWFEYRQVIPYGFSDFLTGLKLLVNRKVTVVFFTGNHDMWMKGFFEAEYGIRVFHEPQIISIDGNRFFIGHGDGLGPGDKGYKWIKRLFRSSWAQNLYYLLHPDLAISLMKRISQRKDEKIAYPYKGSSEMLIAYCNKKLESVPDIDYFIFGHRHLVIDYVLLNGRTRYINTGDWMQYFSYAVYENNRLELQFFKKPHPICV